MSKKIKGLISIILSILILMYFEEYTYKIINVVGINVNNYSNIIQVIINIIIMRKSRTRRMKYDG